MLLPFLASDTGRLAELAGGTGEPNSSWLRSDAGQLTGLAALVLAALGALLDQSFG